MARSNEMDPNQEPLIDIAFIPSGMTDPEDYESLVVLSIADVALPDAEESQVEEVALDPVQVVDAIQSAVGDTSRRRDAQLGKHSPLRHRGLYADVQPGDFLPQFGVVTNRNFQDACAYAAKLDVRRKGRRGRNNRASA